MNQLSVRGPTQPDRDKIHAVFNLDIFIIQPTAEIQLRHIKNILKYLAFLDICRYFRYFKCSKYTNIYVIVLKSHKTFCD